MDIPLEVHLIVSLIGAGVSAAIASSKGRSAVGWFFLGFLFPLIVVIVIAVLPNLKEQERRRVEANAERRRLREQLRQERMKTEAFRQHAAGRLDAHDDVLGVDTRTSPALGGPAAQPRLDRAAAPPPPPPREEASWYYESNGESKGPVPESTLVWMLENGSVTPTTLVWTEGQADWTPAGEVPAFQGRGRT